MRRWSFIASYFHSNCVAVATKWRLSTSGINFSKGRSQGADDERHFGFVADNRQLVLDKPEQMGIELLPGPFKDFLDPWGNRIEIVDYDGIQFTRAAHVLKAMGLDGLEKTQEAIDQLTEKGMVPE